jgi:hypothetical protein
MDLREVGRVYGTSTDVMCPGSRPDYLLFETIHAMKWTWTIKLNEVDETVMFFSEE